MTLAQRLMAWAQNEEMLDQHYTAHGKDCVKAAELLEGLLVALNELAETAEKINLIQHAGITIDAEMWSILWQQTNAARATINKATGKEG